MTRDHDDVIAEPTPEATVEEKARASKLAKLVDAMLDGAAAPPALEAEDRAMLEAATAIRAGLGNATLDPDRKASIIDAALAGAAATRPKRAPTAPTAPTAALRPTRRVVLPWMVTAMCAAAVLFLLLRPAALAPPGRPPARMHATPLHELIGEIPADRRSDASARIDAIYADRVAAYQAAHGAPR